MKLSPHSLATTPANNVFPVPGAPYSSIPDLSLRGQEENNIGYCKCPTVRICSCLTLVFTCIVRSIESFLKCNFIYSLSLEYLIHDSASAINKKAAINSQ